ncbi:MAG: indole-3-glycerol phosphate synthase [Parasphingorhabdus sp.]|jgi:indole-3-glycerol phosphate synthase
MNQQLPDILLQILARKAEEIAELKSLVGLDEVKARAADATPPRGFIQAMGNKLDLGVAAVIAEIKKASPSKGIIRQDFEPIRIAMDYAEGGAACLSILTDRDFFQGHDEYLQSCRAAVSIPVLRKDFTIDPYQVYEARAIDADCILLIVAALDDVQLQELAGIATEIGLDVLIEVHDEQELARALCIEGCLLGINNRDLRTFTTSLDTTIQLLDKIPENKLVVTESGIHSQDDVKLMQQNGVNCFLVGESLMRAPLPGKQLETLFFGID